MRKIWLPRIQEIDYTDGRRGKVSRWETEEQRIESNRRRRRMRNHRYRTRLFNKIHPSCSHGCKCENQIEDIGQDVICGMCNQGLCS